MEQVVYPIKCLTDTDLEAKEGIIFDWLTDHIRVHFLFEQHLVSCNNPSFNQVVSGNHPSMRFIFINEDMEEDVNMLVKVFQANNPGQHIDADGDGPTEPGDRTCPCCGHI